MYKYDKDKLKNYIYITPEYLKHLYIDIEATTGILI